MKRKVLVSMLAALVLTSCGSVPQEVSTETTAPTEQTDSADFEAVTEETADSSIASSANTISWSLSEGSDSVRTTDTETVRLTDTETEKSSVSDKDVDVSEWTSLYCEFINEQNAMYNENTEVAGEWKRGCFSLYDIIGDSIPELIIPEGNGHFVGVCIYTYDGSKITEIKADRIPESIERLGSWGNIRYSPSLGCIAATNSVGGLSYSAFYQYSDDKFEMTDFYAVPYQHEIHHCEVGSSDAAMEEYVKASEKYNNAGDWIILGSTDDPEITFLFENADDVFDKIDEAGEYFLPAEHIPDIIVYDDPGQLEYTDKQYLDDLLGKYILADDNSNEKDIVFLMTDAVYFSVPANKNDYLFGQGAMNNILVDLTKQQIVFEGEYFDELGCFSNFYGNYLCGCTYRNGRTDEFIYSLTNDRLLKADIYEVDGEKVNSDEYILDSCGINTAVFISGQESKMIGD